MANCDEGATLRIYVQGNVGASNPTTIRIKCGLERAVGQGASIHGPIDAGRRIRRSCHTAQLHSITHLGLRSPSQKDILRSICMEKAR